MTVPARVLATTSSTNPRSATSTRTKTGSGLDSHHQRRAAATMRSRIASVRSGRCILFPKYQPLTLEISSKRRKHFDSVVVVVVVVVVIEYPHDYDLDNNSEHNLEGT
jgi:hypothetical protein